jgi:hypothetical protein
MTLPTETKNALKQDSIWVYIITIYFPHQVQRPEMGVLKRDNQQAMELNVESEWQRAMSDGR